MSWGTKILFLDLEIKWLISIREKDLPPWEGMAVHDLNIMHMCNVKHELSILKLFPMLITRRTLLVLLFVAEILQLLLLDRSQKNPWKFHAYRGGSKFVLFSFHCSRGKHIRIVFQNCENFLFKWSRYCFRMLLTCDTLCWLNSEHWTLNHR